ncbi:MAG TPA: sigma-70 family RNA polymerase sigma factor [Saprospiraceae bacterium]|nr:sigma-70 family RNA polymerase sigma factor [Saprospiraceae bacterium]
MKNDERIPSQERLKSVSRKEMEEEWIKIQAAQKDPTAFKVLYDNYYYSVFKFLFRRVGDEDLTAEICSLVFLKALRRLNSFEFRGVPFSAWLFRIASNELGQHYRNSSKKRVVSIEETSFPELASEMDTGGIDFRDEKLREVLLWALDDLKPDDLQLIEMRFFEQMPFKEIAEIMSITESNAKVKTYRILERLKKRIVTKIDLKNI